MCVCVWGGGGGGGWGGGGVGVVGGGGVGGGGGGGVRGPRSEFSPQLEYPQWPTESDKNNTQQEYVWHLNTQPKGIPEVKK